MYIPDGTPFQMPQESAASMFQQESPTTAEQFTDQVTNGFSRKAGSFLAENAFDAADALSNTPKVPADQINAEAPIGNDGKPTHITDEPMYQNVANMLIKDKQRQLVSEDMTSRYSNANGMLPTFAVGAASFMADPSNLAMTAYGGAILGGSKVLAGLGALGVDTASTAARVGARVISGAAGGAASMTPLAAAQYGISAYQGGDYDVKSALSDMAFGAVGGALIHGGFGSALHESGILKPDKLMRAQTLKTDFQSQSADLLRQSAPVKAAAMNSTIADVVNGRPADPSAVIGKDGQPPNLSQIADDRKQQNQNGYSPNMTPEEIAAARKTILPNGLKVEPQPSRLPDAEINRYKETVQTALQNAGVENVDDSVVQEIARIKAEQLNPENAVKPRPLAEVQAGKPNPEPVWKSVDITPKPVEVAPRPAPPVELPKLPRELSGAKSGYKQAIPQFASDVDKALYIVREKSNGKSASHDKYIDYLKNKVGMTDAEIQKGSEDVLAAVKQNAEGKKGKVSIPHVYAAGKDIAITVPKKRTLAPMKSPMNALQLATSLGGIKDESGELAAMDAHKHFGYGGRLVRDSGMSLDDFGQKLYDRGYVNERPTKAETLEIIRDGLNGKHTYAEEDRAKLEAKDTKQANDAYHEDLERHAGEMGIDTTGMKTEEIRAELEKQTREAADEHNFLDEIDKEEPENQHDYYPDMEEAYAHETVTPITHEGHEPEVSPSNERSELEAGNASGGEGAEPVNPSLSGRRAESAGADTGRTGNSFEPAKNVAGGGEQGVLGGMEQSAKQAMAARGEKIGAKVEQKPANEGLFQSVIGGGDELDLRIADAEKTINSSGMTVEERADLQQAYKEAADADKIYSDKMKELGQCLSENGVG